MGKALKLAMQGYLLAAVLILAVVDAAPALECGVFYRDRCEEVCAGLRVVGCRSCGFWCEECECGQPVPGEKVCCHIKSATCDTTVVPDAALWMSPEDCDRFWSGYGDKICPDEACGRMKGPGDAIAPFPERPLTAPEPSVR